MKRDEDRVNMVELRYLVVHWEWVLEKMRDEKLMCMDMVITKLY